MLILHSWVSVVGRLYPVQYKGIFGAPDQGQMLLLNVGSTTKPLRRRNGLVVEPTFNNSVVPRAQVPRLARLLPILALSNG